MVTSIHNKVSNTKYIIILNRYKSHCLLKLNTGPSMVKSSNCF